MGARVNLHEVYFASFFEHFNMRFAPTQEVLSPVWRSGGIHEIAALQKQFQLFRLDRPFVESAALLGLGGLVSSPAKDRWIDYLHRLPHMESDIEGVSGDRRIVDALIDNLALEAPLPCSMQPHDGRLRQPGLVVAERAAPTFYLERESSPFLVFRMPLRPAG